MNTNRLLRNLCIVILLISNISCDQISKIMVRKNIHPHEQIEVIENHLTLMRVENTGAFLSLGDSLPIYLKSIILVLFPVFALGFGLVFILKKNNIPMISLLAFSFVIGGGIGNILDRIRYGSVTDFLHLDLIIFQTGIFNMADVSIMTGLLIILFTAFRRTAYNVSN